MRTYFNFQLITTAMLFLNKLLLTLLNSR